MRSRINHKHMIDFLFPVALFFVFALSALAVLLFAARIYRSTTENSARNDTARTSLSYISEKIHQNDENSSISIETFDGCRALAIKQLHENETYYTYIYAHEGNLKELFVKSGVEAGASDGKSILEIHNFSMEQLTDNLFLFRCTDQKNQISSSIVNTRSR